MPAAQKRQLAVAVGLVLLGLGMGYGAFDIPSDAGYAGIGPNFLPWVVAGSLLLCGGWSLWDVFTGGFRDMEEQDGASPYWGGFAWMSAGLLLNAALITTLGFVLSCTLCFVLAAHGLRSAQGQTLSVLRAGARDAVIGLFIAAPVYWMFTQFLAINLPGLTASGWI